MWGRFGSTFGNKLARLGILGILHILYPHSWYVLYAMISFAVGWLGSEAWGILLAIEIPAFVRDGYTENKPSVDIKFIMAVE